VRVVLLVIPCSLAASGFQHLSSGIATNIAFPVPVYMLMGVPQTDAEYAKASRALSFANASDGRARIARAESALNLKVPVEAVEPLLVEGLSHAPASSRGWTLLAETLTEKRAAARACEMALSLTPYDYWLNERRVQLAASLWDQIDDTAREEAMTQARQLWSFPESRGEILNLLRTSEGATLLTRAYKGRDSELKQINYWVARQRLASRLKP